MAVANLFDESQLQKSIERIHKLNANSKPEWGKMSVSQMLAHIAVAYEMDHDDIHKAPGAFAKFMMKLFVKNAVVGPKPYAKNSRTAPQFIIKDDRDFEKEKERVISYMKKTQKIGAEAYNGKTNLSFGPLSTEEWNMMYSKHLDHHLTQFGV